MATRPTHDQIIDLERQYWTAMQENDVDAAVSLTKFPCTLASPRGVQKIREEQYRKMMASNDGSKYAGIEIQSPHVNVLNADTAMITYAIEIDGMKMLDTSTWIRDRDRWACAYHAENPILEQQPQPPPAP